MIAIDHEHELTAAQARRLASQREPNPHEKPLRSILDTIRAESRAGNYHCSLQVLHHEAQALAQELTARGYHLTAERNPLTTTFLIAWSPAREAD